jgi:putative DNA primase/helicase
MSADGSPVAGAAADVVSTQALAQRFAARWAQDARYVAAWKQWMFYDGVAWRPDATLRALDEARAICAAAADAAADPRAARRLGDAGTVAVVEQLARADQRIAASADQWDADPLLLNTPAGTVDLRSGAAAPHRREDFMTRVTAVAPGGDCPRFRAALARSFGGDAALIAFVQRALGYALTGVIAEHALFFCFGTGGNGKSLLLNTVLDILGGYAAVMPVAPFTAGPHARHAAELGALRGARLVVAQDVAQTAPWDSDRIKGVTGGDRILARDGHGRVFAYAPRFKLFIAGNARPALSAVDPGIRRRFKLIPFAVTIPDGEADPHLRHKLVAEWPGILAWLIEGCREWQRRGLAAPPAVTAATADYLAEEDVLGAWLDEWVTPAPAKATESTAALFGSWETFAIWNHEPAGSRKAFSQAMRARGYVPARIGKHRARGFQGLVLRRHSDAAAMASAMSGAKVPLEGL